jgi:hypothetical protein
LHGNLVVSDDGSRVVALQYDFDPNSGADPSNFQLLVIDTGTGTVLQRMPIEGVETVYGLTGAGPARRIFLQVSDNSTGTPHPAILTADLDSGTLSRLETANPYNVLIEESMAYANGDGLLFRYADARLYALDALSPETLQIPWEDPDAYLYPVDTIQGTANAVVYRYLYSPSGNLQEFWVVPLRNPTARHRIVAGTAISPSVAISPDGQRMLMASSPLASLHSFVQEVSLTDGALLRSPGPPGGIELLRYFQYLGSEGDLLVSTDDINTYERLSVIRHDDPQTLAPVATDLDYYGVVYREIDADGTGIAISVALAGNGYARAFLCDANLPGRSVPLNAPAADDDGVFVVGALGTPQP